MRCHPNLTSAQWYVSIVRVMKARITRADCTCWSCDRSLGTLLHRGPVSHDHPLHDENYAGHDDENHRSFTLVQYISTKRSYANVTQHWIPYGCFDSILAVNPGGRELSQRA